MQFAAMPTSGEVVTVRHDNVTGGWQQDYLLLSDVHFDSPDCDRKLLTRHLDEAIARGAGIIHLGDWFDAMGGRNDKRASKSGLRAEDKADNYFDMLVEHSAEYLLPYAANIVAMSDGNHETAITRHNETNILARLCKELDCIHMGYSFFIRFLFSSGGGQRTTRRYYGHHGSGGGGAVTKGAIGNQRRAAMVAADIYHSGHVHESMIQEHGRLHCTEAGTVRYASEWHVITPGYKRDYKMRGSFQTEKGNTPKPVGGAWLSFYYDRDALGRVGTTVEKTRGGA